MTRNDDKLETALVLALLAVLLATGQVHAGIMFDARDLTETVMRGDVAPHTDAASANDDWWSTLFPWMFGGNGWGRGCLPRCGVGQKIGSSQRRQHIGGIYG